VGVTPEGKVNDDEGPPFSGITGSPQHLLQAVGREALTQFCDCAPQRFLSALLLRTIEPAMLTHSAFTFFVRRRRLTKNGSCTRFQGRMQEPSAPQNGGAVWSGAKVTPLTGRLHCPATTIIARAAL
jgi:hypothetical protein